MEVVLTQLQRILCLFELGLYTVHSPPPSKFHPYAPFDPHPSKALVVPFQVYATICYAKS